LIFSKPQGFSPASIQTDMRLELVFIPVIFALAVAAIVFIKPVEIHKTDLSAVFLYWPEAYRYAEVGDPSAVRRRRRPKARLARRR
jgi:hypothetical protein